VLLLRPFSNKCVNDLVIDEEGLRVRAVNIHHFIHWADNVELSGHV
jgi:hypothetical protein